MRSSRRGTPRRALLLGALIAGTVLLPACRQDMHDQAKIEALEASAFFPDGKGARIPPEHTVARGTLHADDHFYRGQAADGSQAKRLPFPITAEVLARGQMRFNAFCSPCHDRVGTGRGMVVQRGFKQPPSLHIPRLRQAPPGYFFQVITNGFGKMSSYASQIPPRDRWAIVAYIQALQFSQHAQLAALSPQDLAALRAPDTAASEPVAEGHGE